MYKIFVLTTLPLDIVYDWWDYNYIINDLLEDVDKEVILSAEFPDEFEDNTIVIYSCDSPNVSEKLIKLLENSKKENKKIILFHLSNEQLNHNYHYYKLCNFVFRSYYDPNIKLNNVKTIPLGYKGKLINRNYNFTKFNDKTYSVFFYGQPKSDRYELIDTIRYIENSYIFTTNGWNDPKSLSVNEIGDIISKTLLIPCPMGNINPDSFRICEVLESGSIPVVKKYGGYDYFYNVFGDNPIPSLNSWSEIFNLYEEIKKNPDKLLSEINNWYIDFKKKLKSEIFQILQNDGK
jgi:hypothetical protein